MTIGLGGVTAVVKFAQSCVCAEHEYWVTLESRCLAICVRFDVLIC